jgi:hypothetical protein
MPGNTLTDRDLSIIYDKMSELLVKEVCESLVNGQEDIIEKLAKQLRLKMVSILDKSDTQSKMNDILMQSINVSLRKATNGPILLYTLLTHNRDSTHVEIKKILNNVWKADESVYQFRKRLITDLQTPPYKEWFLATTQAGGKSKRKTRRKSTRKKRNKKNKTRRGGGMVDSLRSKASSMKHGTIAGVRGLGNKMSETGTGLVEGAKQTGVGFAKGAKKYSGYNWATGQSHPVDADATVDDATVADATVADVTTVRVPATATEIEENTNELYEKYNKALIDMATKKLDETSGDIAKKMMNASYIYMMKNGTHILDTTLNSIESSIAKTNLPQNVLPILVVQSLYQARNFVVKALMDAEEKRKEEPKEESKSDKFEQPDESFVADFMDALIEKIKVEVGDVDPAE